ncbi:hypothetical protein V2J09_017911 [Rumex salicifolius]
MSTPGSDNISNEAGSTTTTRECCSNQQLLDRRHSKPKKEDEPAARRLVLRYFPQGLNLKPFQEVLAELVGTFIVVMGICGISGSAEGSIGLLEYALAAGAGVVVAIFCTGSISGAHINPANTIAFAVFGHFPWSKVPFYMAAQVAGSTLATYIGKLVYGLKPDALLTVPYRGCAAAFWVELLATFIVTFLAASMAKNEKSVGQLMGIVMGIAVMLAVLITGPVSGGSLNPARSLGPAIVAWKFKHIWVYLAAPTLGSVLGVFFIHILCLQNCTPPT